MTKSINTLVQDIQSLFNGHKLSDHIDVFKERLGETFVDRFQRYSEERKPDLYMSSLGKPLRQLWYDLKGFDKEVLSADTKLKFLFGDILEEVLILLAIESGHKVERLQEKVELDGVRGRTDCIIDGVIVDCKSASTRSFEKFKDGSLRQQDPFGYVAQLASYSVALGGLDGAFLAIDKQLGHICLLQFSASELAAYKPRERIKLVREAVKKDTPPERCYEDKPFQKSGNRCLDISCSYCSHKARCWSDCNGGRGLRTAFYSNKPIYLTHVEKEPKVFVKDEFPVKDE